MKIWDKRYFIGLLLFVALVQLLLYLSGVHYEWEIIFIEFVVLFGLLLIYTLLVLSFYRKLLKNYNELNYDYVIRKGEKLRKYILGILRDYVILMVAIAYFSKNEDDKFQSYVNKITDKKTIGARYYWLTVFNVLQNRMDEARMQFDLLIRSKESNHYQFYKETAQLLLNLGDLETGTENTDIENLQSRIRNPRVITFIMEKHKW